MKPTHLKTAKDDKKGEKMKPLIGIKRVKYGNDFILAGHINQKMYSNILLKMEPEDRNKCIGWMSYRHPEYKYVAG